MKFSRKFSRPIWLCCWLLIIQHASAQQTEEVQLEFRVRYVTVEAVYFNGGTADGIRPGDNVWVMRNRKQVMPLTVKYAAQHSASCVFERTRNTGETAIPAVRVDDVIVWTISRQELLNRTQATEKNKTPTDPAKSKRSLSKQRFGKNVFNGQLSMQAFGQQDKSMQRYDFVSPSAYLRLNLDQPAGLPLRLAVRLRSSQNYRQIGASGMQKQPASNRVYELSLEYATPQMPIEFTAGRLLRNEMRGVGYLDGAALGYRLNRSWKTGVFAGAEPERNRSQLRLDERKLGGFLQTKSALGKNSDLTVAAAVIGRYARQQISREYLAADIDLNFSRQVYFTQYVEVDYNRKWRRQSSGSALTLSNAYFNAGYYPRAWISFGASYDARRPVRTWETRSIADSLIDQNLQQGWRGSVSLLPTALTRITFDAGWQDQKDSPDVYSAGISFSASNLLHSNVGINARLAFFGNSRSASYYPALELSRSFGGVIYVTAGGSAFLYQMQNQTSAQINPWERVRLEVNLMHRLSLGAIAENFHGDTMKFLRGFVDLGWRF